MARVIPKRVLEDIRFRNDIAEIIGSYFSIKRAGSSFKALCPFHKEKTPSFHVNPQRQIYHCFGCGEGGDVFRFMMQYEGVNFTTAAKMLAQRAGIHLELEEDETGASDKTVLYKLHAEVANLYHHALLERKSAVAARRYLEKRELTEETVKEFLIGYAPDRWDSVLKWAKRNKYRMEQVETAGLILKKSNSPGTGSDFYDRFRNRLMFPILDEQERVIGFSGRCLDDDSKTAKYINSPETPLFHKGRVLYALNKARRHIVESREAIVCEGQIDVVACHQAGFKTAVASQGTAFTEDHVRVLKRYADSVCIVFDPDRAGQDASVKAAAAFMTAGLVVRIANLPQDEDPDTFIRKNGPEAFRKILNDAESIINYQIAVLSSREDAGSEIGMMRIAKSVLQTISHSPSSVQRAKLVQEAAQRLGLPDEALREDLRYMLKQAYQRSEIGGQRSVREPGESATRGSVQAGNAHPREEVELCEHMIHITDCTVLETLVREYLPLDMLSDPFCRTVVKAALESRKSSREIQDILHDYDDSSGELQKFAAGVLMVPSKVSARESSHEEAVKDIILRIWQRKFKKERAGLDGNEAGRRTEITYHLNRLKKWENGKTVIEIELSE